MVMISIRGEQYLYIKTINGTRMFKDRHGIDAERYLVLPSEINQLTFGQKELSGRAFWGGEAMIVVFTNCMLLGFLFYELSMHFGVHRYCAFGIAAIVFGVSALGFIFFIRNRLGHKLLWRELLMTLRRWAGRPPESADRLIPRQTTST